MNISSREILIYLSIKNNGDWMKIYKEICMHKLDEITDDEVIDAVNSVKSKVITILDPDYPEYLKHCPRPPFVLYYYGNLSLIADIESNIAVVGARKCSSYGARMTKEIVSELARDLTIVSGMAIGIDSVAHNSALLVEGKTVAVIPCGIDTYYPFSNKDLCERIKSTGLVISEYPGNLPAKEDHFKARNRIIAFLAKCVLVTEAKLRSGTSMTVGYALCVGRDVFCVPTYAGQNSICNYLIAAGAGLVEDAEGVRYLMQNGNERGPCEFEKIS